MLRPANNRNRRVRDWSVGAVLKSILMAAFIIWLLYRDKLYIENRRELAKKSLNSWRFDWEEVPNDMQKSKTFDKLEERNAHNVVEKHPVITIFGREFHPKAVVREELTYFGKGTGSGDDEIDGEYRPKSNEEVEQGGESSDEEEQDEIEKGTGSGDDEIDREYLNRNEKFWQGGESSDEEEQEETDVERDLVDDQNNEMDSQEAREGNCRRYDDGRSVRSENLMTYSESNGRDTKSSVEENVKSAEEEDSKPEYNWKWAGIGDYDTDKMLKVVELSVRAIGSSEGNVSGISMGENKTMPTTNSLNATVAEKIDLESVATNSKESDLVNSMTVGSNNQVDLQSHLTTATESALAGAEMHGVALQNVLAHQDPGLQSTEELSKLIIPVLKMW